MLNFFESCAIVLILVAAIAVLVVAAFVAVLLVAAIGRAGTTLLQEAVSAFKEGWAKLK